AKSSWNFVKSLGTSQGWKNLGQGMVDLAHLGNQFSPKGVMMRSQIAQSANNYIDNIPNMSAFELGYDIGYATEKIGEGLVLTRGAGFATNAIKTGAGFGFRNFRFFSNTTTRGTTIFKTGKDFRIDFDFKHFFH